MMLLVMFNIERAKRGTYKPNGKEKLKKKKEKEKLGRFWPGGITYASSELQHEPFLGILARSDDEVGCGECCGDQMGVRWVVGDRLWLSE